MKWRAEIVSIELDGIDLSAYVESVSWDGEEWVPVYSPVREAQRVLYPGRPSTPEEPT